MAATPDIVRIKITLDDVKPTVMRRIEVLVSVKLDALHEMIQAIMPWGNDHLYEFRVRESRWGFPCRKWMTLDTQLPMPARSRWRGR